MSDPLKARIRAESERLGFFRMGVARAGPLPRAAELENWLSAGMHGEMSYMARQAPKRRNPSLVLEHARSIVTFALNYHAGAGLSEDPIRGRISRYALGEDYHALVSERLRRMEDFIRRETPSVRSLSYVDSGPVMEKVWGAESTLGWAGKHSNLIAREQGSWFFIGIILLDIDLEPDPKEDDHCGSCTSCLAACPTGAIVSPYVVDARLCISYLTIELRGTIPRELRPLIGNRIFGCDDCQEVCPWNRFAVAASEPGFRPRPENLNPELAPLVRLSPEEFNKRFHGSPIRRTKRDGFVRNVVVALGNSGSPEAMEPLSIAARDSSALVRAHAVWALLRIPHPRAAGFLAEVLVSERDPSVLDEFTPIAREGSRRIRPSD